MTEQRAEARGEAEGDGLPPRPASDASDDERARAFAARRAARFGAPTLEHFRRAYAGFGAEWPGDDVIRQRHLVGDAAADPAS